MAAIRDARRFFFARWEARRSAIYRMWSNIPWCFSLWGTNRTGSYLARHSYMWRLLAQMQRWQPPFPALAIAPFDSAIPCHGKQGQKLGMRTFAAASGEWGGWRSSAGFTGSAQCLLERVSRTRQRTSLAADHWFSASASART